LRCGTRADEVVAFAEHIGTPRAALFDFGHTRRPVAQVGDIQVTHVPWDVTAGDPQDAARRFVENVRNWLADAH
jgi:hypothetical protein